MCNYFKNYYIYSSCSQPDSHILRTSLDGNKESRCSQSPHDRFIVVVGRCHLCSRWGFFFLLVTIIRYASSVAATLPFSIRLDPTVCIIIIIITLAKRVRHSGCSVRFWLSKNLDIPRRLNEYLLVLFHLFLFYLEIPLYSWVWCTLLWLLFHWCRWIVLEKICCLFHYHLSFIIYPCWFFFYFICLSILKKEAVVWNPSFDWENDARWSIVSFRRPPLYYWMDFSTIVEFCFFQGKLPQLSRFLYCVITRKKKRRERDLPFSIFPVFPLRDWLLLDIQTGIIRFTFTRFIWSSREEQQTSGQMHQLPNDQASEEKK